MTFLARAATPVVSVLALVTGLTLALDAPAQARVDPVAGGQTASPADSLFPNQGNSGYDVSHYDINFKVDVTTAVANAAVGTTNLPNATTTITAATTGAPLSSYSFDFQGSTGNLAAATLNVDSVTVNGQPATFSRIENTTTTNATTDVHKLIVTPASPVDGTFTTVVNYSGRPVAHTDTDGSSEGWNNTTDGATFLNQPVGAMTLFPNNNTPRDKATYTFTIDAPAMLKTSNYANAGGKPYTAGVAANGELLSVTPSGDGTRKTWVWDQQKPMASELSMVSIGRYDMYTSNITLASGRTIPEWTFIDPAISVANQTTTLRSRAQFKSLIDFFESKYGPYPGNSTGVVTDVVPSAINYALETQDRSFFPNSAGGNTFYHEVMHQWWGDSVSPTDWNDITLNEGPATYSESQFPFEGAGSTTTSTETSIYNSWNSTSATSSTFTIPGAAMTQASQLFGSQVYAKGAMSLEALRTVIGAADFETLMRQYQLTYGGGQITGRRTAAFEALAESISGRDLTSFFQTWWFTSGKPAWPFKYNLNLAGPTGQVLPGDSTAYTLSVRNTGKVAMTAGQAVISVDVSDLTDDAALGTLPANVTQAGNTLLWSVPATALAATSTVTIPVTVNTGTTGNALKAVASSVSLGGTCLECTSSVAVGTAPISPAPVPTITGGTPTVGATLTADTTGWAAGTTFAYQWLIDGTPVPGATASTYVPTGDVVGLAVTVRVTGTLAGFNKTTLTSAATAVGVRATPPTTTPTIAGTPKIGVPLTVDPGTWPAGTVFTYQWRANGTNISGATGPVYTPAVATQVGQTLDVVVTGTKFGYTQTARTSAATTAVAAGDALSSTPTPVVSGTPKVGVAFAPDYGSWDDGVTLTFQWRANGTNISGATTGSFVPTAAQQGQTLDVVVTGTKGGITPVVRTSNVSNAVETGTQVLQPTPTITGTPRAGSVSTGVPGTWDSGTTRTYRWLADGVEILGATAVTYTPTTDQIGQALTFEVTSTRAGYTTVVKTSAPKTVLGLAQTLTPTPTITGTPKVAETLTADPGTWDDGTTLTYQWYAGETAIPGATGATYVVTAAELGAAITVAVTSTKPTYETVTRTSAPTDAVSLGDQVLTPKPTISGVAKVGVELTGDPGTWDAGTTLTYQWNADGDPIDGATGLTYTPGASRLGAVITFSVTSTKAGYGTVTRHSDPTFTVALGDLALTPTPTITGTPQVGVELTADPGTWDDGTTLTYEWRADGTPVEGATGLTFTPGADQVGTAITLRVVGSKPGYTTVGRTSDPTGAVAPGTLTLTPTPTVVGTPMVDVQLTASTGAWDEGVELTYQWLADGTPIEGATEATYTPGPGKVGASLSVAVTGSKPGYTSVTRTSGATAPVALGDLTLTPAPTVSGTPQVGLPLSGDAGTWDDGVALTFRWLADGVAVEGADGPAFTPTAAEAGKTVVFEVTGTKTGYTSVTTASSPTAAVALGSLSLTPVPTITGTAQVDAQLTAVPGDWDPGVTFTYQWLAGGIAVTGANASTFTPGPDLAGATLTVAVTGSKPGYAPATRVSDPTGLVALGVQSSTPTPTITGTAKVGAPLTAVPGSWDAGVTLGYQWLSDGTTVPGATSSTYTPAGSRAGTVITVEVTGTKAGYATVARTSAPTAPVAPGDLSSTPRPTINGKVQVGQKATVAAGSWDSGTSLTYQWLRNGNPIAGATSTSYTSVPADADKKLSVAVTGAKAGFTTVTRTSAAETVSEGKQTKTPSPTITGTARVGQTLTAKPGPSDAGSTLIYKWYVGGKLDASTTAKLTLVKADQGKLVYVKVIARKGGYADASGTSDKVGPVKAK